jgi:hypothetical protein
MARIGRRGKFPVAYRLFMALWWYRAAQTSGVPAMERDASSAQADRCLLNHQVFSLFNEPLFRRSESDGTPSMMVRLGERVAAIPLRSLQLEFNIADDTDDGRMLGLIAQSLDFVTGLRLGDTLPSEVLNGEASWEPDALHLLLAKARLQWQLVTSLNSGSGADSPILDAETLLQVADDPARKQLVQQAFAKAAESLGLPSREAVIQLVEELARELAYIEALRDRLLRRVKGMAEKLSRIAQGYHGDADHVEKLTQVRRLTATALKQIGDRFLELDGQTGEVMAALRNADSQRTFIRSNRDWLYRTQRSWQPLLQDWDVAGAGFDEGILLLLNCSYQFLAPRFMPVTEWASLSQRAKRNQDTARRMVW